MLMPMLFVLSPWMQTCRLQVLSALNKACTESEDAGSPNPPPFLQKHWHQDSMVQLDEYKLILLDPQDCKHMSQTIKPPDSP